MPDPIATTADSIGAAIDDQPVDTTGQASRVGSWATKALMLLPRRPDRIHGLRFGGEFPQSPALAALVLSQILLVRLMQSPDPLRGFTTSTDCWRQLR